MLSSLKDLSHVLQFIKDFSNYQSKILSVMIWHFKHIPAIQVRLKGRLNYIATYNYPHHILMRKPNPIIFEFLKPNNAKNPSKVFLHWNKSFRNNSLSLSSKAEVHILYDPTIPLRQIYTKEVHVHIYQDT